MFARFWAPTKRIASFFIMGEKITFCWKEQNKKYFREMWRSNFSQSWIVQYDCRIRQDALDKNEGVEAAKVFREWARRKTNYHAIGFDLEYKGREEEEENMLERSINAIINEHFA